MTSFLQMHYQTSYRHHFVDALMISVLIIIAKPCRRNRAVLIRDELFKE